MTAPLGAVVADAVRRWFLEASKEASKGDVVCSLSAHLINFASLARPPQSAVATGAS